MQNCDNTRQQKTKLIIVDDHPLVIVALEKVIQSYDEFEIVGTARDGEEAIQLVTKLSPQIVIMDISMPKLTGIEATKRIKELFPKTLILILTVYFDFEHLSSILDAGADGYLIKTAEPKEIIEALRGLIAGEAVISRNLFKSFLSSKLLATAKINSGFQIADKLHIEEIKILELAAKGFTNKEIARELKVSESMVKNRFSEIFGKLEVSNRAEAVTRSLKYGVLDMSKI